MIFMNYSIYLAGPISNITYDESVNWRNRFVLEFVSHLVEEKRFITDTGDIDYLFIKNKYNFLSPMRDKENLSGLLINQKSVEEVSKSDSFTQAICNSKAIITRDYNDVLNCSCIVANLTGDKISIGTVMEIAWAKSLVKPVVAILNENNNIYDHPMINECLGFKVYSIKDAVKVVSTVCY